jgi:hypothetical protein
VTARLHPPLAATFHGWWLVHAVMRNSRAGNDLSKTLCLDHPNTRRIQLLINTNDGKVDSEGNGHESIIDAFNNPNQDGVRC